jgi:hypothetical protein
MQIVGRPAIVRAARLRNDARVTAISVYSRALAKAAELLGGRPDIEKWIGDDGKPPREIFLRVVDIILDETSAPGSDDTAEPPPGRDAAGPNRYVG